MISKYIEATILALVQGFSEFILVLTMLNLRIPKDLVTSLLLEN